MLANKGIAMMKTISVDLVRLLVEGRVILFFTNNWNILFLYARQYVRRNSIDIQLQLVVIDHIGADYA